MLKIGTVKWKGRCGKHHGYDPEQDGEGGIRGGCERCRLLLDIFLHHTRLVRAMREFGAASERSNSSRKKMPAEFQPMLFDIADQN
ncbi:MAG: hypothetical protein ABJF23_10280 [Bryobacteraceae bacterium]